MSSSRIEVHRAYHHVALSRFGAGCGLLSALCFLLLNSRDWFGQWFAAYMLVMAAREAREFVRPCARTDDDGVTFADGWMTRRVAFADVLAWQYDPERYCVLFTTHDGSMWSLLLGEIACADRERLLAHLTTHLRRRRFGIGSRRAASFGATR
jgi:hypothetical protein